MNAWYDPGRWRFNRVAILAAAGVLLLFGLALGLSNEASYKAQKVREIGVQADILSASVAPALMFDDSGAAQDYLTALGANPDVEAAAVYNESGARIAAFQRSLAAPPPTFAEPPSTGFSGRRVVASMRVMQNDEHFGSVYLRTSTETTLSRLSRYLGVGLLVVMAALVLGVLGLAQGALTKANAELAAKAAALEKEIQEREKAEEELLQSRKMEAIGQLTGGIAHDFNNLLMVVVSGLRLLDRHPDPERRAKTVEAMRQAVERGAGLTKQLLAFSRRQALSLEAVDVVRQVGGMREMLERSLRADILIDMALPAGLWPIETDPAQLELAVLNLAVNARDAMPKGGVLTISAKNLKVAPGADVPPGDYVEIIVADTGTGIPPEIQARVFEPYFTTKQTGQGTGLGLSQIYGFVNQSGGVVRLDSVVNEGTRFSLVLPRSKTAPLEVEAPAQVVTERSEDGVKVLVVEDDDNVAAFVSEMLQELGRKCVRVGGASAALGALSQDPGFDIVFSDIIMPGGMNGIELAREIRKRRPDLPVLLTTGYSGGATSTEEFPLLRKPYQIEDLDRAIASALRRKQTA